MRQIILFTSVVLLLLTGLYFLNKIQVKEEVWGKIELPKANTHIVIEKQQRPMHKFPFVWVSHQEKGQEKVTKYKIEIDEDRYANIGFRYNWLSIDELHLHFVCGNCMHEIRTYSVQLNDQEPYLNIKKIARDSVELMITNKDEMAF